MDLDIDDILASLDNDTSALNPSSDTLRPGTSSVLGIEDYSVGLKKRQQQHPSYNNTNSNELISDDYNSLMEIWRNERCSPELLPYPELLLSRILSRLQRQIEFIESLSMGLLTDPSNNSTTNNSSNDSDNSNNNNISLKLPLLCMEAEIERLKFLIRSFLRCRLSKIDKYSMYYLQKETINSDLLSKQEQFYLQKHSEILIKLFNNTTLKFMPEQLQAIQDTEGSISMIDEPNLDDFVFIAVKLDNIETSFTVTITELDEEVELTKGGVYVMRYKVIKHLLFDGKIQLL